MSRFNYFQQNIMPYIKSIQHFETTKEKWAQYDLKSISSKDLLIVYNYFKSHYTEIYPRIQKFDGEFIGDIQVKLN